MNESVKPLVYITGCRYNAVMIHDDFIERLKPFVSCVTACPEVDVGLGVPRDPIRVVIQNGVQRLMQPSTQRDITRVMNRCVEQILERLSDIDGFILKL